VKEQENEVPPDTLKTAIDTYPHTRALKNGSITPDGYRFDHVEVSPIIAAFRRMIRNMEFDVSEMAISTYLCARAHNKPITAIPVFPLRSFQHGAIAYNTKSGITSPADLAGRRVGVRAYTVTGGLWVRGILKTEYGVDLDKVTWVIVDEEHVVEYQPPPNVERAPEGKDLAGMLAAGEIDAAIGAGRVDSPDVKPLIPDAQNAALAYFTKTGVYPINHTVVVKSEHLDATPKLAVDLFDAFRRAKDIAVARIGAGGSDLAADDQALAGTRDLLGSDPVPYGVAPNRATLDTVIRFNVDQQIIPRAVDVEDVFAKGTLDLTG
jgi:4,5-dihydroxyphthalate decarboxylase